MTSENCLKFMTLSWVIKYHLAKLSICAAKEGVGLLQLIMTVEREAADAIRCGF